MLATAREVVKDQQNISLGDKERLLGFLEGGGKKIKVMRWRSLSLPQLIQ